MFDMRNAKIIIARVSKHKLNGISVAHFYI